MHVRDNHDRLSKNCQIKLKENKRGKQNKLDKTTEEDQRTKLKVVEDGRLMCTFLHWKFKPFLSYLYNTYVLWIHIVTKATYFSNLYVRCDNRTEIPLDLRQEQESSAREDNGVLQL